jgi:hypothetical protein
VTAPFINNFDDPPVGVVGDDDEELLLHPAAKIMTKTSAIDNTNEIFFMLFLLI